MPERGSRSILAPGVIVSFLSALLLAPASASSSVRTQWDTAPACVDADAIPSRIDALIRTPPKIPVFVSLGAVPEGEAWTISMRMDGPVMRSRTLRGRDCATLTEAVALVVAVQLDAVATASAVPLQRVTATDVREEPEPVRPPPKPALERPPPPGTATRTEPKRPPAPPPRRRWGRPRPVQSITLGGELGIQPRHAGFAELSTGLAGPRAQWLAAALLAVGPPGTADALPSVGGRFLLITGLMRGCGVIGHDRFALPLCAGPELGDLRATGTGLTSPRTVNTLWIALAGGARPLWRVGPRLEVGGLLELVVPLRRHRFAVPEAGTVHLVPAAGIRLGASLRWQLP